MMRIYLQGVRLRARPVCRALRQRPTDAARKNSRFGKHRRAKLKDVLGTPVEISASLSLVRPADLPVETLSRDSLNVAPVLSLKRKIDARRAAMEALADDGEDLEQRYGA